MDITLEIKRILPFAVPSVRNRVRDLIYSLGLREDRTNRWSRYMVNTTIGSTKNELKRRLEMVHSEEVRTELTSLLRFIEDREYDYSRPRNVLIRSCSGYKGIEWYEGYKGQIFDWAGEGDELITVYINNSPLKLPVYKKDVLVFFPD